MQRDQAKSYSNIGGLLEKTGKPGEAVGAYKQALQISQQLESANPNATESQVLLAGIHHNLGVLHFKEKRFVEARDALLEAMHYSKRVLVVNPQHPMCRQFLPRQLGLLTRIAEALNDDNLETESRKALSKLNANAGVLQESPSR